jgi:hypothetical protein
VLSPGAGPSREDGTEGGRPPAGVIPPSKFLRGREEPRGSRRAPQSVWALHPRGGLSEPKARSDHSITASSTATTPARA